MEPLTSAHTPPHSQEIGHLEHRQHNVGAQNWVNKESELLRQIMYLTKLKKLAQEVRMTQNHIRRQQSISSANVDEM